MIGGVAGGIAEYLVLDSTVVRVVFVLLFILGVGVTWPLVYGVLWLLMPESEVGLAAEAEASGAQSSTRGADPGVIFGVMLLGLGVLVLSSRFTVGRFIGGGGMGIVWPLLVIAVGVVVVMAARDRMRR